MNQIDEGSRTWSPFNPNELADNDRLALVHAFQETGRQIAAFDYNGRGYLMFIANSKTSRLYWGIA